MCLIFQSSCFYGEREEEPWGQITGAEWKKLPRRTCAAEGLFPSLIAFGCLMREEEEKESKNLEVITAKEAAWEIHNSSIQIPFWIGRVWDGSADKSRFIFSLYLFLALSLSSSLSSPHAWRISHLCVRVLNARTHTLTHGAMTASNRSDRWFQSGAFSFFSFFPSCAHKGEINFLRGAPWTPDGRPGRVFLRRSLFGCDERPRNIELEKKRMRDICLNRFCCIVETIESSEKMRIVHAEQGIQFSLILSKSCSIKYFFLKFLEFIIN